MDSWKFGIPCFLPAWLCVERVPQSTNDEPKPKWRKRSCQKKIPFVGEGSKRMSELPCQNAELGNQMRILIGESVGFWFAAANDFHVSLRSMDVHIVHFPRGYTRVYEGKGELHMTSNLPYLETRRFEILPNKILSYTERSQTQGANHIIPIQTNQSNAWWWCVFWFRCRQPSRLFWRRRRRPKRTERHNTKILLKESFRPKKKHTHTKDIQKL